MLPNKKHTAATDSVKQTRRRRAIICAEPISPLFIQHCVCRGTSNRRIAMQNFQEVERPIFQLQCSAEPYTLKMYLVIHDYIKRDL